MNNFLEYIIYDKSNPLLFGSGMFLIIFLVFFTVYAVVYSKKNFRTIYVLLFSLFFYYKAGGLFVFLLIAASVANFLFSHLISIVKQNYLRRIFLTIAIISNLGVLGYFKYAGFFITNINEFAKTEFLLPDIILPIGISFYLFQAISYVVDVYKKEIEAEKSFLDFSFYLCFFPQLVAGPIVRAKEFIPQIKATAQISFSDVGNGIFLILLGLVKKTVISDFVSLNLVDRVFSSPDYYTPVENLLAVYGYTIQIYCDFSGYSDMAIGLALLLGYKLPLNFRTPFQSKSVTEFWRRWHISLSSWLRDYLYKPLGGNREGKIRTYINLFLVMLIGGLWHGANWKFVIWGGLHGIALAFERIFRTIFPRFTMFPIISTIFTFHFVAFTFIFFRANDFETAFSIIKQISLLNFDWDKIFTVISSYKLAISLILFGYFIHFIPERITEDIKLKFVVSPIWVKILIVGIVFRISFLISTSDVQPFIYFQF